MDPGAHSHPIRPGRYTAVAMALAPAMLGHGTGGHSHGVCTRPRVGAGPAGASWGPQPSAQTAALPQL
eukprot:7211762-Lingulodinium_polyedra.AAC.1